MEPRILEGVPTLLDLSTVAETERAATWSGAALSLFPGLSVDHTVATPMLGQIRHVWMGGGSLWSIQSPPAVVTYAPLASAAGAHPSFTLMMQWKGRTTVDQNWRHCSLGAGDICLLDERIPFRLEGHEACEIVFLRMPRQLVLGRNPHLEHYTASALHAAEAGAALLGATLSSMLATVPYMQEERRFAALSAIIHLLGAAETTPRETMGVSITARIWNRRLEQSAADLRDPLRTGLTASRIAFANGFEDAAHFTRAFKRRYGQAPAQWRQGKTATH